MNALTQTKNEGSERPKDKSDDERESPIVRGWSTMIHATEPKLTPEQRVEQIFSIDSLVVRALDSPRITKTPDGLALDYSVVDREVDDLKDEEGEGLSYASSTLLLLGESIPTYKAFGFMFDGAKSELHHLHTQDSASHGQGDDFQAVDSTIHSLLDLASSIRAGSTPTMNEVVGSFKAPNLVGIFAVDAVKPSAKVDAWFTQQHLADKSGIDVPVYSYRVDEGTLEKWERTPDEVKALIEETFSEGSPSRMAYLGELQKVTSSQAED